MSIKRLLRSIFLTAISLLLLLSLASCKSNPLKPSSTATKEVGTVGNYTVLYEELYTVAKECYVEGMSEEELKEAVYHDLTYYYTILTLCDQAGVEYDEKELDDDVQAQIDSYIDYQFGGKRSDYLKALSEQHTTDHYVRFVSRVNLLYSKLEAALIVKGELSADENEVVDYIKNNFVKTQNFMLAINKGDDPDAVLADAQAARDALVSGETSLYDLIGGRYKLPGGSVHEDTDPDAMTIFGKGTMDETFEKSIFALEVNEYSDVILVKDRELASGELADCYFVSLRLPLDETEIKSDYNSLYDEYAFTVINEKLVECRKNLTFVPNEYASSLTLSALPEIGIGTDVNLIVFICIFSITFCGIIVTIIFIVKHQKAKKKRFLEEKARRTLAMRGNK